MKTCDKCLRDFKPNNFARHYKSCVGLPIPKSCEKCGKWHEGVYASGRFCSKQCACCTVKDPKARNAKISAALTGSHVTEETKLKISRSMKGRTISWKDKLSVAAKRNCLGGNISKQTIYFEKKDGSVVFLQSSYEIRYAKFLEENEVKWTRPPPVHWIDSSGVSHRYYADFYLVDFDQYIDTKNDYLIVKDAEKIKRVSEQNNIKLKVLSVRELEWIPLCCNIQV